jgi:RNA-directed DNA polymerase
MDKARPFCISKREVWEAYKRVAANRGAAGIDDQSIEEFEQDLSNNLYKLWNRMSSGSYFPAPVRRVDIPKRGGGTRPLGIPTVADRIAQTVVKRLLEPELEKHFDPDSYGYRPGKSAIEALGVARQRCWKHDWVLDLDIKGFFDSIDHDLMMRAVRRHTTCTWALLYIERWLKAPVQMDDGTVMAREKGTPQGGVISPLLANLFLHYAFDRWMRKNFPRVPFERYADDVICHCGEERQAKHLKDAIDRRFAECGLSLHPQKTQIVYCRDNRRKRDHPILQFDFLGYTFRPRRVKSRAGEYFIGFVPAISRKAATAVRQTMRDWQLHHRSETSLDALARTASPALRGWLNYYGAYYRSDAIRVLHHFDLYLTKWAMRKYKKLRRRPRRARRWLQRIMHEQPMLLPHWAATRHAVER